LARKILLADDSVTAQNMGRRILSDAGYDVTTVNNGSAALKKIAESKPDLIVLDVYMPGYGGLEVCQRLREAPETARIPILLTVGKLEPFKAEEARRVNADGFIVKPFEASELLTALTKLEDKIVPQSQPAKPSRFAKAMAGAEELASGKEFGDSQTGWKNRLPTPAPYAKARVPIVASVSEEGSSEQPRITEIKSGLEEALLSSMPQDITPEEIASIKAAGSALSSSADESSFAVQPPRDDADGSTREPIARVENIPELARQEFSATEDQTTIANGESEVPRDTPATAAESPATTSSQSTDGDTGNLADEEVSAALASLTPANGHGNPAASVDAVANEMEVASTDPLPVTMAAAGAIQEFSGPRWIAELVSLSEDESTLVLSREMEKAYAAYAAADEGRMRYAGSRDSHTSVLVAEARSTEPESDSIPAESHSNWDNSESRPEEPAAVTAPSEDVVAPEPKSNLPDASPGEAVTESDIPAVEAVSAYAAAASAGPSNAETTTHAEYTAISEKSAEDMAPASDSNEGDSEHATAWANWKQVRESVIGSQLSSQIADTVAELQENGVAEPESQPAASPVTADETSEISTIVDSVLADLKPKLMAEIARKMGKEKNQ
jgi:CheY-like chemotaxis protein